ncbi:MAG: type IV secretion system DNA-binding domain-containing protein [Candidatus Caldarchaeum sp.]
MALKPKSLSPPKRLSPTRALASRTPALLPGQLLSRPSGVLVGRNLESGELVVVKPSDLKTHTHIVGTTGVGKSKFLEILARQIIVAKSKPALIVLDPHGDLYYDLLAFCAAKGIAKRLVLLDPRESRYITGFNPMRRDRRTLEYQSSMMLEAIRKCWGMETFHQTPRMARWLYNTILTLIEANLTLKEAPLLLDPLESPLRRVIVQKVSDPIVRRDWEWFERQKPTIREERTESAYSRIRPFLQNPAISNILTQQKTTIQFDKILSEGKILLVNLKPYGIMSHDDAQLLGTLLINDILAASFQRDPQERRSCYLMIDEFQNFVTKDLCTILAGGRKFTLYLILAHQHLSQLQHRDPEIFYSTAIARTKIVFGGLPAKDAELAVQEMAVLNLTEVKQEIYRTFFEPVETTRRIVTTHEGRISSQGVLQGFSSGAVYGPDGALFDPLLARSEYTTSAETSGRGESWGISESESPFYIHRKRKELASREFWRLDEQLYRATIKLRDLPNQVFALKAPNHDLVFCQAPKLRQPKISPKRLDEFKHQVFEQGGFASKPEAIQDEERQRLEALKTLLTSNYSDDDEDVDYAT